MRTCILVWPDCAWTDIAPAVALLAPTHPVTILAATPDPVRVAEGFRVVPDAPLTAAPTDLHQLLLPGGDAAALPTDPSTLAALAALAGPLLDAAAPLRIGAIGAGVTLLACAGLLTGRQVCAAATPDSPTPPDLLRDGALLTARPSAALRFARLLAEGARPDAAAAARALAGTADLPGVDPYERWVVELTVIPGVATTREHVRAHVEWLATLEADGRLVAAGPFPDDAAGMLVLRVRDRDEAWRLSQDDPFVRAGVRTPRLRRWVLSCADNGHQGLLPPPAP